MQINISKPIAELKADALKQINQLAGDKILALYPQHMQANLTARAVELISLNEVGSVEWLAIDAIWVWIKLVRTESNVTTTAVTTASTAADINSLLAAYITNLSTI
jgi:hypothetical protein